MPPSGSTGAPLDRALSGRLEAAGQAWIAEYAATLESAHAEALARQLASLDLEQVARVRGGEDLAPPPPTTLEPLPYVPADERGPLTAAARRGAVELAAGRVGFVVLAGGQASRLRWEGPKGTYPIGPRTDRSLFRILVEQVLRAARDVRAALPLAITTAVTSDAAIRAFFESHDCFGFPRADLSFSCQGQLPALDDEGRFLLQQPHRVFTSPDGHGGALQSLERNGILAEWEERGVARVCCCQVDNPLLRVVDRDFLGREGDVVTKAVRRRAADERVGVLARAGGRPVLVEYSDLAPADAARTRPDGAFAFELGSIAAHVFDLGFLRRELPRGLPLHAARKEIACVDAAGTPQRVPGRKFERFLFDLFPRAREVTVCEVRREEEFEPLKNREGEHSPEVVRAALDRQYRRWYERAGATPPDETPLELSPLLVDGPDDLA